MSEASTQDQPGPGQARIGALLVRAGVLTEAQLDEALQEQSTTGGTLGSILLDRGMVTEGQILMVMAPQMGMEYIDLADFPVDMVAVTVIPASLARKHTLIPVARDGNKLTVAMLDPGNVFALDDIRTITRCEVKAAMSTGQAIKDAIDKYYRADSATSGLVAEASAQLDSVAEEELGGLKVAEEEAGIIKLVNVLIEQAVLDRASDIHIDPTERDVLIRYRVDDVLFESQRLPKNIQHAVTSRLKIMANLDIAERRKPQSGRISRVIGGKEIELRVESLPIVWGEKVVMRILDSSSARKELTELGFLQENFERYQPSFMKPYGTILVTGPTGSGKSTTLYATLNAINDPAKNIITVENPVEYKIPGINQVQTNDAAGMTFAAALRSILRADPNIVLVGEIRDHETAKTAIEAALTGHLVLSTLHTNDAASTPTRLIEMGVEPFLVATALDCVLAQRLARRLCDRCKEAYEPTEGELRAAGWDFERHGPLQEAFRPGKCGQCGQKGYRGRFGVHEVMTINEELERMIAENVQSADILKTAVADGMLTLKQAGLLQVRNGNTTFEEVLRTIA